MYLTAVEFAKLVNDLRCDARRGERRANPRAPARARIDVIRVRPGVKTPAVESLRVRDISRNGLGLMVNQRPEEGQRMLVLLPKNAKEEYVLLCEVARVTRLPDSYCMGLQMVRRVTEEECVAFMRGSTDALASLLPPPPAMPATTTPTPAEPTAAKPDAPAAPVVAPIDPAAAA